MSKKLNLKCIEHQNNIQRICLSSECQNRVMCLLCDQHLHGKQFCSIMDKTSENYKKFADVISEQIDSYLLQLKNNQQQVIRIKQKELLQIYHKQLKNRLQIFLQDRMSQIYSMLQSQKFQTIQNLKIARINKNFIQVEQKIYKICFRAYEGEPIRQILSNHQTLKSQQVYQKVNMLHESFRQIMEKNGFNIKIKVPQIRNKDELFQKNINQINANSQYQVDFIQENNYLEAKLLCVTQQFDSIISSSIKTLTDQYITVGYDKKLRILKRSNRIIPDFQQIKTVQFNNILTKISQIGDDVYAIAQSKQLLIQMISQQRKGQWECKNIMKLFGHNQRINDISRYNTRILASSSYQGTKIWDLYKQKCEYTFKQTYNPTAIIFLPKIQNIAIGYNNHICKLYSIEKLKNIRKYELNGVALTFSQQKLNQNTFYVGSFPSHLSVLDVRLNKLAFNFNFKQDAVTTFSQSIFQQNKILLGFRNGIIKIFDLQMRKVRASFEAQNIKNHMSKPNGIVGLYQESQKEIVGVCCNSKQVKMWEINNINNIKDNIF